MTYFWVKGSLHIAYIVLCYLGKACMVTDVHKGCREDINHINQKASLFTYPIGNWAKVIFPL